MKPHLAQPARGAAALAGRRQQALAPGMTPTQIQDRLKSGWLVSVHRGVYRLPGGPASPQQALHAACLAGGPAALTSHRGAAVLRRLGGVEETWPDVRRRPGYVVDAVARELVLAWPA